MRVKCKKCTHKHLAQAFVLLIEMDNGYPSHFSLAIGHLGEAADECVDPSMASTIRDLRHQLWEGVDIGEHLTALLDQLAEEIRSEQ